MADKAAARSAATAVRKAAHKASGDRAGLALASAIFPVFAEAGRSVVSAFYPFRSEIDTRPLLGRLAGEGWTTALPIVVDQGLPLIFRRWLPGEPTVPGAMGIARPTDSAPEVVPDVLIVPLLAFDRQGYRLGYGGGYYDRTLAKLRGLKKIVAIGAGYAAQQVSHVPRGDHDQPLDFVITENGVIPCG